MLMKKELEFYISQGEGYNIEFKESHSSTIGKEMCAFANASGGKIFIGITDSGIKKEIKITNKLKSEIQVIGRNLDPKMTIHLQEIEGILIVDVPEGKEKPYSIVGKFYLRQGANSQQLTRNEIKYFFQKEGLVLFDERVNEKFDIKKDLNKKSFNNFLRLSHIRKILPTRDILTNLNLVSDDKMKNAGVLLFSNDITKFLLQSTITCVLFYGRTKYRILDRKEFDADLFSNYENAMDYLRSKLNTEFIIKGGPREEKLELPEDALREAILNAIAHRNYFVTGANIQIYIFSDRVEITNPGGLVRGMTIKELGKRSLSRNNLLFGLMQRMDLVEKIGSGILRMKKAMKEYGLPNPKIETNENWFSIIFKRMALENVPENVPENREDIVVEIIRNNNRITIPEIAKKAGVNEKTIKRDISKLKEKDLLKRVGPDKGGYWKIIKK